MADTTTIITGVADGAFESAFNGLPDWATQDTLLDIEKILSNSLKIQTSILDKIKDGTGGGLSEKDLDAVNDELQKLNKNLEKTNEEDEKRRKREKRKEKEEKDEAKRDGDKNRRDNLGKQISEKLLLAGTKILGIQKQYFDTSHDLFKSGVNLVEGQKDGVTSMESLQQMVAATGLRLEQLQEVIEKYSTSINAIGVNKFAKAVGAAIPRMDQLGFSSDETIELMGAMVDSESNFANVRNRSQKETIEDLARFGVRLNKLALATGQSIEKLTQNNAALSKSNEAWVIAGRLGPEAAKRVTAFASSFKDADVQSAIMKFSGSISTANEDIFQALNSAGLGNEANKLNQIFKAMAAGSMDEITARREAGKVAQDIQQNRSKVEALESQRLGKNSAAANQAISMMAHLTEAGNNTADVTDASIDAATKSAASLAQFTTALNDTRSLAERTFPLLEKQVDLAREALVTFNNIIKKTTDLLEPSTRSWIGVTIEAFAVVGSLGLHLKSVRSAIGWIAENLLTFGSVLAKWVGGVTAAFAAGYAFGTLVYKVVEDFKWFANLFDWLGPKMDSFMKYIPGSTGADARENIARRERETASKISVPVTTAPTPSTIKGPGTVNTAESVGTPAVPSSPGPVVSAPLELPNPIDINSMINFQNNVLSKLLESSQNMVSTSKDILRYTKAQI